MVQIYFFYSYSQCKSVFLWYFNRCFCGVSVGVFALLWFTSSGVAGDYFMCAVRVERGEVRVEGGELRGESGELKRESGEGRVERGKLVSSK